MYVCTYVRMYVCMYVRTHVRMYGMHVCMDGWMDGCMYVCICTYVYIYIYIYQTQEPEQAEDSERRSLKKLMHVLRSAHTH